MFIKKMITKYWDIIPYLFFGACTTMVNVAIYWLMAHPMKTGVMLSTVTAWLCAVLFAYATNRKWVFHSSARNLEDIRNEFLSFLFCRMATGVMDWACMLVFVGLLKMDDVIIKFSANVLVIALNYFASKLVIFRRRGTEVEK